MTKWSTGWIITAMLFGVSGASMNAWADEYQASDKLPMLDRPSATSAVTTAAVSAQEPPQPQLQPESRRFKLERVNGLALSDDLKTIYEQKGPPVSVESDPLLKAERILVYSDCRVGLYENFLQYVAVPAAAGSVEIDGVMLPLEPDKLKQALGEPDWTAEDGIVYKNGSAALKLFIDSGTGELVSVHYFSELSM